jgi:fatty acid desaturase
LTFGHAVSAFVPGHNLSHHRYPNTPLDGTRVSLMRYRFNVLNQLLMFVHCIGNINRSEFKFKAEMRKRHPGWVHQYDLELVIVYAVKLSLLYMDWKRTILFVLLPHLIATWNLVNLNFWQHDGCDPDHPYNHSRNITGKLVNFFLFNNGYHGVHHMQPGLHWSLAPAYHQEHLAPFNHPNLNRPSLALYLFESCIYPGKRVMYDGRPVVLSAKEPKTEDWVARAGDAEFAFAARSFVAPERRERDRSHEMAMS